MASGAGATAPLPRRPRTGLVLGAGGVLGAAWMAGALAALQRRLPYPAGAVDLIVGTSAGSVMAAALRCGVTVDDIVEHQRGTALALLPALSEIDRDAGGPLPPLPRMRVGSPRLLLSTAMAPHRMHPWVAASALVLQGRARHTSLEGLVRGLLAWAPAQARPAIAGTTGEGWAPGGETWVMAVDYDSGRRVAFGCTGAPPATLPEAVVASCSIPGWYRPTTIGGRRYVDGGVHSPTSLDLLAEVDLDEVYVLAPMASYVVDAPRNAYARLERRFRWLITIGLQREARKVEARGIAVTVLTPGPEDLTAIGANLMDPRRRIRVLDTSLRTSAAALAILEHDRRRAQEAAPVCRATREVIITCSS
jgi:NTE family protein